VTVHHDLREGGELSLHKFITRYAEANLIICLNSFQQETLRSLGINNTELIPHGYNADIFSQKSKITKEKRAIGFVSHYYPRLVKGEDYLIQISKHISTSDFMFILVGRKRLSLARQLREMGFSVELYENLPYRMFPQLYQRLYCLLITSDFEGGPASLPEALISNTPVFSMPVGMVRDYQNNDLITILTGIPIKDAALIQSPQLDNSNKIGNQKVLSYNQVSERYYKIFSKYAIVRQHPKYLSLIIFYHKIAYSYNTVSYKKKFKLFYVKTCNAIKFLYMNKFYKQYE